ncbi:MAG TPA: ABC transporter permease [Bacteriovoracaceae bacterium]|nr:ABC transporter permease [Bacteriovoracaceae bacterium]
MFTYIDQLGKFTLDMSRSFSEFFRFIYLSFRCTAQLRLSSLRPLLFTLVSQIYFTGFKALPLITFIALASGTIIVLQSTAQLSILGSQDMMGNILVVTIVRELGPLLTALIVIARSGSAVATEIGSMQINKEIEALRIMSIDPLGYVVFPRILGGIISIVCLAFYFNVIALIGGYLVSNLVSDLPFSFYTEVLAQALTPNDLSLNIFKNSISGLIIFSIATHHGMQVRSGPQEVPVATTNAVVDSIMAVVAFNLSITIIIFTKVFA